MDKGGGRSKHRSRPRPPPSFQLSDLVDAVRLLAAGDASVTSSSPFPRAEAVLDGLDAATAFLGHASDAAAGDADATTPSAADAAPLHAATVALVQALGTARAGDVDAGTAEWRARFARLHKNLCAVLASPATPAATAEALSSAYADLLRAWLARFAPGAPPAGGDARLLRGVKRALRDRRQPLPLLPGDAAAMLTAAADALVHGGGGERQVVGGGDGLCRRHRARAGRARGRRHRAGAG